jgi:PilZ domain
MSNITLPPNQPLKLRPKGEKAQYTLKVLDSAGEHLVVRTTPQLAAGPVPDTVELSFGYGNQFWRGTVHVEAVFERWWFLSQPRMAECRAEQRRSFVRIAFEDTMVVIPTNPLGEPIGAPRPAKVANLSAGGCLAHMPADLEPGDHVLMLLTLPEMPANPVIGGVVRRGDITDDGAWYGVRFESLDDTEREDVARFVAGYIKAKLREGIDVTQPEYTN